MAAPNMATITASLERSLKDCTLNQNQTTSGSASSANGVGGPVESSPLKAADATLELNSQTPLPLHWEQCLDLKTGQIFYMNWTTGVKVKEDPRRTAIAFGGCHYHSEEDDCISYESVNSSFSTTLELSPCSSIEPWIANNNIIQRRVEEQQSESGSSNITSSANALVVAGCKRCLMYCMVPKQLEICPECCDKLLHFDRLYNGCCC